MSSADTTTYEVPARVRRPRPGPATQTLGLTLCFHPELERIGEVAPLGTAERMQIDRHQPVFGQPGLPPDRCHGLGTSFVSSRYPLVVERSEGGTVCLLASSESPKGAVCLPERAARTNSDPIRIASDELERRGVILVLNSTVVLLLHSLPPPPFTLDGAALANELEAVVARVETLAQSSRDAGAAALAAEAFGLLRGSHAKKASVIARAADLARSAANRCADREPAPSAIAASAAAAVIGKAADLDRRQNGIVGESLAIRNLWRTIYALDRVGPVMISGEQGVGKSDAAYAVARFSARKEPLVYKNAANLIPSVAPAELFGRKKGFLGADDLGVLGIFRSADKGTLFLDEIADLPETVQAQLLDAVERDYITPVGENQVPIDVRLITASNRDPAASGFKRDLHDRLGRFRLRVPTLRERREDIPRLLVHFLRESWGGRLQRAPLAKDKRAAWAAGWAEFTVRLLRDTWQGNVRVLRDVGGRAALANPISIDPDQAAFMEPEWPEAMPYCDAPESPALDARPLAAAAIRWTDLLDMPLEAQRATVEALLTRHRSQLKAAAELGAAGPTFHRLCKALGFGVDDLSDEQLENPPAWANPKAVTEVRNGRKKNKRS